MRQVGVTTDDRPVVAGLYALDETHGIPLDVLLDGVRDQGAIPCWLSLVREGVEAGASADRWSRKVAAAATDAYGPVLGRRVALRLTGEGER